MKELHQGRGIAAIFTHDPAGLYGHGDHVAVADAIEAGRERLRAVGETPPPVVAAALTGFFRSVIQRRPPGAERPLVPITHVYDLSEREVRSVACATKAHKSQEPTLRRCSLD